MKLVVDPVQQQAQAVAGRIGYTADPRLSHSWTLDLEHQARLREAHKAAGELLAWAEELGWTGGPTDWSPDSVHSPLSELHKLGVTLATCVAPTQMHPPGFYLMPEGWGDIVPALESLPGFASEVLASERMAKLRRQLGDAEADERHAFLFIGWEYMEAIHLTDGGTALPASSPELPIPVDGVWLAATTSESRVVAWLPDQGWTNAARILSGD